MRTLNDVIEFEQNVHQNEDTEDIKTQQNLQFDKWTIDEKERMLLKILLKRCVR